MKKKWKVIGVSLAVGMVVGVGGFQLNEKEMEKKNEEQAVEDQLAGRIAIVEDVTEDELVIQDIKSLSGEVTTYEVTYTSEKLGKELSTVEHPLLLEAEGEMTMTEYHYLTELIKEEMKPYIKGDWNLSLLTSLAFQNAHQFFIEEKQDAVDLKERPMRLVIEFDKNTDEKIDEVLKWLSNTKLEDSGLEIVLYDQVGTEHVYQQKTKSFQKSQL